jgi:acetyl-CoA C-acetyltransferase
VSITGKAYVVGAFDHLRRVLPDKSTPQHRAKAAAGAFPDAGLSFDDVDE